MTIAPIIAEALVALPPAETFGRFFGAMRGWWPPTHSIGSEPMTDLLVEPRVGGRWFERAASGAETQWGRVLVWEPPGRAILTWQIGPDWRFDPALLTEVEVSFAAEGSGTRVRLEHRRLEAFGHAAHAETLRNGWPGMVSGFAAAAVALNPLPAAAG